jgi:hypothetical protein
MRRSKRGNIKNMLSGNFAPFVGLMLSLGIKGGNGKKGRDLMLKKVMKI